MVKSNSTQAVHFPLWGTVAAYLKETVVNKSVHL